MRFTTLTRPSLFFVAGAALTVALPIFAAVQNPSATFSDVKPDAYFSDSIENLARQGIMKGYDDGRFGPNDYVTRGQVAVMIDRYNKEEINALRAQLEEMRSQLNIGMCSDKKIQLGEECDDGNTYGGDGCSASCQKESFQKQNTPTADSTYSGAKWECQDGTASKKNDVCMSPEEWSRTAENFCSNRCGASGKCGVNSFVVEDACMGTNPQSSKPSFSSSVSQVSCETEKKIYSTTVQENQSCVVDNDCKTFTASCPYLTCGEAINASGESKVHAAADAYLSCQKNAGSPISCAQCISMPAPSCVKGKCLSSDRL